MAVPTQNPTPKAIKLRPRYLRAIPSLVVLTTAMAWGALPDWDVGDDLHKKAGVSLSQPLNLETAVDRLDSSTRPHEH